MIWSRLQEGKLGAVEIVASHGARAIGLRQVEARVLEPGGIEHALLQEIGIRLSCGVGQGLGQQIEAEIGIEDAGARREQQDVRCQRGDVVLLSLIHI